MRANGHHISFHSRSVFVVGCSKTLKVQARDCIRGVAEPRTFRNHAQPVSRNLYARGSRGYNDVILFGVIGIAVLLVVPPKEEAKALV